MTSLKVIGTGFGRTGTDSMREALEILGFGPCHHMRELIKEPEHERLWRSVVAGATPDWDLLLGGGFPRGKGHSNLALSRKLVGELREDHFAGHTILRRNRGHA